MNAEWFLLVIVLIGIGVLVGSAVGSAKKQNLGAFLLAMIGIVFMIVLVVIPLVIKILGL